MVPEIFVKAIHGVLPMLFIFSIIVISIRVTYLLLNKQKIILYKEILMFCFIIYILLLYYIVTFQDNNYGTNNLIPFREIFRYEVTSSLFFRNVIGNILLFIPFGLFISYIIKCKNIIPAFILTLLTSISIEFTQILIGRTADIDDVILNVLGGVFGYLIYKISKKFVNKLPSFMKNNTFLNLLTIILVFVLVYIIYRLKLWEIII